MIPVRVPATLKVTFAGQRIMTIARSHPLAEYPCPVCDVILADRPCVLVFVGIAPEDRKDSGFTTGAAITVHADCAGAAG